MNIASNASRDVGAQDGASQLPKNVSLTAVEEALIKALTAAIVREITSTQQPKKAA